MTREEFARRAAVAVMLALAPLLVWYLFNVVLIVIGALLIAALLEIVAEPFNWLRFPRSLALVASAVVIASIFLGAGYLFGAGIMSEMQEVIGRLSEVGKSISSALRASPFGAQFLSGIQAKNVPVEQIAGEILSKSLGFAGAVVVTIFIGVYIAAQPAVYRDGLIKLFPFQLRATANDTVDLLAAALRLWLLGQIIEMVMIGVLFGFSAWIIGLPPALALGVIAGVAEFVPYLGPIIAIIPAALVAVTLKPVTLLWTIVAFELIHLLEGNLIMPVIQQRMVFIPPAVMLSSIVFLSSLFGLGGVVFAAPLTVVLYVLITKLYVRDSLGEPTTLPGEQTTSQAHDQPR